MLIRNYIDTLVSKGITEQEAEEIAKDIIMDALHESGALMFRPPHEGPGSANLNYALIDKYVKTGNTW